MQIMTAILSGYFLACLATTLPGMLNMTSVAVSLEHGRRAGRQFAIGTALTFGLQAAIALIFADYLSENPGIIEGLKKAAVGIFLVLAGYFFIKARRGGVAKARTTKPGQMYGFGILLAAMNALTIPFFFAMATWLQSEGYLIITPFIILSFSCAVFMGSLTVFLFYGYSATYVERRAAFITRNINYILCGLFVTLASFQVIGMFT
ncbi:MAG: hypothetical protein WBA17_15695 [Saprospiraceae bacterium]